MKFKNLNLLYKTEILFLKQLRYWCNQKKYGIAKDGRIWIYNTLDGWADQLKISKSSVQRTIRYLKEKGIIESNYLSCNKRNRTLFYSINYDKLRNSSMSEYVIKNDCKSTTSDHMVDHMYNKKQKQINIKSYKSLDNSDQKNLKVEIFDVNKQKNTTVQDMIKVFNKEFPKSSTQLNKNLARNIVAAFKLKFESSVEKWKEFISLVKTSKYLMSESFKLTVNWLLKFSTIDRLKNGELGVKLSEIQNRIPSNDDLQDRVEQQIAELDEEETFKTFRKQIAKKLSNAVYLNWFAKIKFEKLKDKINMLYPSKFIEDIVKIRYINKIQYIANNCMQYSLQLY